MSEELSDIETRADCERLVRAFYGRALEDPLIGWIFTDVAKLDLEAHVPVIASFWETILLGARSYGGGAFAPHAALHVKAGLRAAHFERWLALWHTTVDELFAGERAELAKAHAVRVAHAFHARLQTIPSPGEPVAGGASGLPITRHGPAAGVSGGLKAPRAGRQVRARPTRRRVASASPYRRAPAGRGARTISHGARGPATSRRRVEERVHMPAGRQPALGTLVPRTRNS